MEAGESQPVRQLRLKLPVAALFYTLFGGPGSVSAEYLEFAGRRVGVNASNHTLFTSTQNLEDTSLSPHLIRSETHLRAETGYLSVGAIAANRLAVSLDDGADRPLVLEKKHATYETDTWKLVAGDSHFELGRGIALTLFRDEIFGIDNTVEGVTARYTPGDWEFRVLGGRVNTLQAPVALIPFQDPLFQRQVWMVGGDVRHRWRQTQVSAHYLSTLNQPLGEAGIDRRWHTAGATFTADGFAPGWDLYAESNVMLSERLVPEYEALPAAFGSYGALVYAPLPWKFKLEVRDYRNYAFDFQRPPTMEEDIVTSLNFSDITAARLSVERRMNVYDSIRASLLAGEDRIVNTMLQHAVVSGRWKVLDAGVESRLGYRTLAGDSNLLHGDIRAKIPTLKGQAFEVGYRKLYGNSNLNFSPNLDDRNFFDLGYTFSAYFSLNVGVEYVPSNPAETGQGFFNAGTLVKIDSFTSRAFVGSTSGGPQCSGGICRMVPPYSGVMLEGTYAF